LNEFLNPANETIVDADDNIFVSVVDHYSVDKPGEESESSDEEVEEVDRAEALRCVEIVKYGSYRRGITKISKHLIVLG
jgi:hypothetical protein